MQKPLFCLAHRGGEGPENSMEAIEHSLSIGIDAIEIDVWHIADTLIVTHDRRLGKQLPGNGRLVDQTKSQLQALRLSNGEPLPTLEQVLETVNHQCLLNIELKGPDCAEKVCQTLRAFTSNCSNQEDHYLISSFDHMQLKQCQTLLPKIKRGVLIEGIPLDLAACTQPLDAYSFHLHMNFLSPDLVHDAHKRGLKVYCYTANHKDDWQQLIDLQIDGAFTDFPTQLKQFNASMNA